MKEKKKEKTKEEKKEKMIKTTITMPEDLWKKLKIQAIEEGKPLYELIIEKLRK
ncbi:hypothetical protein J7K56_01490 [Candidatus Calescamantes bacterium]|nr:hypothetical protein [Candidatus Calescamantes bacterium]